MTRSPPEDGLNSSRHLAVSVVICAHNGARDLPTLFGALRVQTLPRECYEIVLVDDASTDNTVSQAAAEEGVRVVRADGHVGLPRARNIGMAAAAAPLIALTDTDTTPDPCWLELGVRRFDESGADMLAGGITVPLGDRPNLCAMLDAAAHFDQEGSVRRGFGVGANLWLRQALLDKVGGFNEHLAAYGGDDNEFGQRATSRGAEIVYAPEVRLAHPPRASPRDLIRKGYRLGFGLAAHRRYNVGPLGRTRPLYSNRGGFMPQRANVERLRRTGCQVSRSQEACLHIGNWLLVQLPRVYGDFRGERSFRGTGCGVD